MKDLKTLFRASDGEMTMSIGDTGKSVSGVERLAQKITNLLLTDKNSNFWHPSVGAGIRKILSSGSSSDSDVASKKSSVVAGIMSAETYVIDSQDSEPLSDDEKLSSLQVVKLEYNRTTRNWDIDILIETVSGLAYVTSIN